MFSGIDNIEWLVSLTTLFMQHFHIWAQYILPVWGGRGEFYDTNTGSNVEEIVSSLISHTSTSSNVEAILLYIPCLQYKNQQLCEGDSSIPYLQYKHK